MRLLPLSSLFAVAVLVGCNIAGADLRDLAADNACFDDSDCCVVVDDCQSEVFVVTAAEFDTAVDLVDSRQQGSCAGCVAPTVVTECFNGSCASRAFSPNDVTLASDQPLSSCGPREVVTSGSQDIQSIEVIDGYAACGDVF